MSVNAPGDVVYCHIQPRYYSNNTANDFNLKFTVQNLEPEDQMPRGTEVTLDTSVLSGSIAPLNRLGGTVTGEGDAQNRIYRFPTRLGYYMKVTVDTGETDNFDGMRIVTEDDYEYSMEKWGSNMYVVFLDNDDNIDDRVIYLEFYSGAGSQSNLSPRSIHYNTASSFTFTVNFENVDYFTITKDSTIPSNGIYITGATPSYYDFDNAHIIPSQQTGNMTLNLLSNTPIADSPYPKKVTITPVPITGSGIPHGLGIYVYP
jgi:hypothetical protein